MPDDPTPPRPRIVHRTETPGPSSPYETTHEGGGLTIRKRPRPQLAPRFVLSRDARGVLEHVSFPLPDAPDVERPPADRAVGKNDSNSAHPPVKDANRE